MLKILFAPFGWFQLAPNGCFNLFWFCGSLINELNVALCISCTCLNHYLWQTLFLIRLSVNISLINFKMFKINTKLPSGIYKRPNAEFNNFIKQHSCAPYVISSARSVWLYKQEQFQGEQILVFNVTKTEEKSPPPISSHTSLFIMDCAIFLLPLTTQQKPRGKMSQ